MLTAALLLSAMIFEPGEGIFRSDAPRQTEGWMGLYCSETCALRPASLEYGLIANDKDRLNAQSRPRDAFLMFRDVAGMTAGEVAEARFELDGNLRRGQVVQLMFEGSPYELRMTADDDSLTNATVTLRHGAVSQVLFRMNGAGDEPHMALVFAGDLDRDGKLDVVMVNSPKYSVSPMTLYLSTAARAGELVREVTTWDRYAC